MIRRASVAIAALWIALSNVACAGHEDRTRTALAALDRGAPREAIAALNQELRVGSIEEPPQLKGDEIPIEARIVAVSDIFDALTTTRPYKGSWPNQHALAMLQLLAIDKLDSDCVTVLIDCQSQVARIQQHFADGDMPA